jgi:hypothetical protein
MRRREPFTAAKSKTTAVSRADFVRGEVGVGLLVTAVSLSAYFLYTGMSGPQFLALYTCLFGLCWMAAEILRSWTPGYSAVVIPAVIFFSIGLARIVIGLQHGMHRFLLLILGMLAGSLLILLGTEAVIHAGKQKTTEARCLSTLLPVLGMGVGYSSVVLFGWVPLILILLLVVVVRSSGRSSEGGSYFGSSCGGGGCGGGDGGGGCGGGGE